MGICFQEKDKRNQKETIKINPIKNTDEQIEIEEDSTDVTLEDLQEIYNYLSNRIKFLENKYGIKLNTQNNDNGKPESIKDYQLMIDKLSKEVFELEKKIFIFLILFLHI